jgi:hypothetical protein
MKSCITLDIEQVYTLGQDEPALAFEADICTRWKFIPVQWFSELLFHIFLSSLSIDIIILIHVIDLIHQIIELGKNRNDGYCKMLIWDLKKKMGSKKPFPALAVSKNAISSGNRGRALSRKKQNLSPTELIISGQHVC